MQSNEKPCRHEYVKIFQRKFKERARRWTSTRGFLPTGFSHKDFAFLSIGTYCFCTVCRKRLFPVRIDVAKVSAQYLQNQVLSTQFNPALPEDNIRREENTGPSPDSPQPVEVEELQVESVDVADIVDKGITVSKNEVTVEEDGEE